MPRVQCPTCSTTFEVPERAVGKKATCTVCKARFRIPGSDPEPARARPFVPTAVLLDPPPDERSPFDFDDAPRPSRRSRPGGGGQAAGKYCHECGERIRVRAEICPACGVRQPDREPRPARGDAGGVKVPVLISAIFNIVVGLFWLWTCFGVIFAVPMFVLCVFEFAFWSQADDLPPRRLADKARTLGIFEIVVGLANTATLICGVITLINSGKLGRRRYREYDD